MLSETEIYGALKNALFALSTRDAEPDLGSCRIVTEFERIYGDSRQEAISRLIQNALETLRNEDSDSATIIQQHLLEGQSIKDLQKRSTLSRATLYRREERGLKRMAEIIHAQEAEAQERRRQKQRARMPSPTYTQLFGVDAFREYLLNLVADEASPRLILLQGMGGAGKTALADALLRAVIREDRFDEIGWITAQRHRFFANGSVSALTGAEAASTASDVVERLGRQLLDDISLPKPTSAKIVLPLLRKRLRESPHLIVIDNLETLPDVSELIPILRDLAGPSKFLLTSRRSLPSEPDVFHISAPELSAQASFQLLRHEARLRNVPQVATADDDALAPIYETVGGNPLALRLVVGQLRIHSLPRVIQSLRAAEGRSIEALYDYIYRRAWDDLGEIERQVLLTMPLTPPSGGDFEQLAFVSQLPPAELQNALDTLINLNLVDRRGDLDEVSYTIHSLTRTFLLEQVIKWKA